MTPLLWSMISRAAVVTGPKMSPTEIVRELRKKDSVLFEKLAPQTVGGWIDRNGECPRWSERTLQRVEQANRPGGLKTRVRVLVSSELQMVLNVAADFNHSRQRFLIPQSPKNF